MIRGECQLQQSKVKVCGMSSLEREQAGGEIKTHIHTLLLKLLSPSHIDIGGKEAL